jgi:hypothetical protein
MAALTRRRTQQRAALERATRTRGSDLSIQRCPTSHVSRARIRESRHHRRSDGQLGSIEMAVGRPGDGLGEFWKHNAINRRDCDNTSTETAKICVKVSSENVPNP